MKFATSCAVAALHLSLHARCPGAVGNRRLRPAIRHTDRSDPPQNEVIVTGTRERGRTQYDTLSPVDALP